MKRYTATILLFFAPLCLFADAQFDRWDKDQSKTLTKEELPEAFRKNFDRVDTDKNGAISLTEHQALRKRANGNRLGDAIQLTADIPYQVDGHDRQKLDLLLPTTPASAPLPVIVFIHGGAWKAGMKESGRQRLKPFVASGKYAGVTIGYRLSQHAIWPAQIHDCKAAIRWVRGNAEKYNLDPERIAVWGTSAGGHLVNMLGVSSGVDELEGKVGAQLKQSSQVSCVVNFFGPTQMLTMGDFDSTMDHNAPHSPESLLIGAPIQENKAKANAASPLQYVTSDDAPFLHVHGTKDPLVPFNQAEVFHAALEKAGVATALHPVVGAGHGFKDEQVDATVAAFLAQHLFAE